MIECSGNNEASVYFYFLKHFALLKQILVFSPKLSVLFQLRFQLTISFNIHIFIAFSCYEHFVWKKAFNKRSVVAVPCFCYVGTFFMGNLFLSASAEFDKYLAFWGSYWMCYVLYGHFYLENLSLPYTIAEKYTISIW